MVKYLKGITAKKVLVNGEDLQAFNARYLAYKDGNAELRVLLANKETTIAELRQELAEKDSLLKEARLVIECAMHKLEQPNIVHIDLKG